MSSKTTPISIHAQLALVCNSALDRANVDSPLRVHMPFARCMHRLLNRSYTVDHLTRLDSQTCYEARQEYDCLTGDAIRDHRPYLDKRDNLSIDGLEEEIGFDHQCLMSFLNLLPSSSCDLESVNQKIKEALEEAANVVRERHGGSIAAFLVAHKLYTISGANVLCNYEDVATSLKVGESEGYLPPHTYWIVEEALHYAIAEALPTRDFWAMADAFGDDQDSRRATYLVPTLLNLIGADERLGFATDTNAFLQHRRDRAATGYFWKPLTNLSFNSDDVLLSVLAHLRSLTAPVPFDTAEKLANVNKDSTAPITTYIQPFFQVGEAARSLDRERFTESVIFAAWSVPGGAELCLTILVSSLTAALSYPFLSWLRIVSQSIVSRLSPSRWLKLQLLDAVALLEDANAVKAIGTPAHELAPSYQRLAMKHGPTPIDRSALIETFHRPMKDFVDSAEAQEDARILDRVNCATTIAIGFRYSGKHAESTAACRRALDFIEAAAQENKERLARDDKVLIPIRRYNYAMCLADLSWSYEHERNVEGARERLHHALEVGQSVETARKKLKDEGSQSEGDDEQNDTTPTEADKETGFAPDFASDNVLGSLIGQEYLRYVEEGRYTEGRKRILDMRQLVDFSKEIENYYEVGISYLHEGLFDELESKYDSALNHYAAVVRMKESDGDVSSAEDKTVCAVPSGTELERLVDAGSTIDSWILGHMMNRARFGMELIDDCAMEGIYGAIRCVFAKKNRLTAELIERDIFSKVPDAEGDTQRIQAFLREANDFVVAQGYEQVKVHPSVLRAVSEHGVKGGPFVYRRMIWGTVPMVVRADEP